MSSMEIREAGINDIQQIQEVRRSVRENILSNPALVTDHHCKVYLSERGKGWVAETDNRIVGFAIADLEDNNVWALFMHPDFERKGIGKQLHHEMLSWYFNQGKTDIWLSTAPNTRAENFYRKGGWHAKGLEPNGEIRFEMTSEDWASMV